MFSNHNSWHNCHCINMFINFSVIIVRTIIRFTSIEFQFLIFSQTGNTTESGQDVHTNMGTDTETRHGKGNIGVTTYGKMISEELELRPKLDIYKFIVTEFKEQFCVMVY